MGLKASSDSSPPSNILAVFLSKDFPQVHQLAQLTPVIIESYKVYLVKTQKAKVVNLIHSFDKGYPGIWD